MSKTLSFVYVTMPNQESGQRLAETLIGERIIACANILPPHTSIYRWQGQVEMNQECIMILKTSFEKRELLFTKVAQLHPFDTPCIVDLEPGKASEAFSQWVKDSCNDD